MILNIGSYKDKAELGWYSAYGRNDHQHIIEKVASIKVDLNYALKENMMLTFFGDLELSVIKTINTQFRWELTNPKSKIKQSIKSLAQKRKWWQW